MSLKYGIILYVISLCLGVNATTLPSFLKICHESNPKIGECIYHNAYDIIRPRLNNGIPELDIQPFGPLVIPESTLMNNDLFRLSLYNVTVHNFTDHTVKNMSYSWDHLNFTLTIHFPAIKIETLYNFKGKVVILDLERSGSARVNASDITAIFTAHATLYEKKGKKYLKLMIDEIDFESNKIDVDIDNIFPDSPEMNNIMNVFFNNNIQSILIPLKPLIIKTVSDFIIGILDQFYNKYSYDEIFPNS